MASHPFLSTDPTVLTAPRPEGLRASGLLSDHVLRAHDAASATYRLTLEGLSNVGGSVLREYAPARCP